MHQNRKDILVEIKAISVNPVDYKVRATVPADDDAWKVVVGMQVGL
jgi:NADPH:quinone reductase-like Zn-dependent oxidoreductase